MGDRLVYGMIREDKEKCSLGIPHRVYIYEIRRLYPTGETREYWNGYSPKEQTPLYVDYLGRIYHQQVSVDYYNNISYLRDDDKVRFYPRPTMTPARNAYGTPI